MNLLAAVLLALSLSASAFAAPPKPSPLPVASFNFDGLPVSHIVRLIYEQAWPDKAYVLDPAVLQDMRPVSFRYGGKDGDFKTFLVVFLRSLGYTLDVKNNADLVRKTPEAAHLSPAEDADADIFYYRPQYRDGAYLVEMLAPLFTGKFTSQRTVHSSSPSPSSSSSAPGSASSPASASLAPAGSALAQIDKKIDQLLFTGSPREVATLRKLLAQIDIDPGQVLVSGVLYEVQTGDHEGSALQLAASLFSGKFTINLGAASEADNFFSFKSSKLSAIMQSLNTDSRFKVLSSPSLRVSSGSSATFTVGQDVPVLGALTFPQGSSSPVQSVDYRSSGVIFTIAPDVRDASIDVSVSQQVSTFVTTTTGVNNSPTLTKRYVSTHVALADGDVVVLGGLREDRDSGASSGLSFLPQFLQSKTQDRSHSEILLFLQLRKI
jgi:general secretion pathway protein D